MPCEPSLQPHQNWEVYLTKYVSWVSWPAVQSDLSPTRRSLLLIRIGRTVRSSVLVSYSRGMVFSTTHFAPFLSQELHMELASLLAQWRCTRMAFFHECVMGPRCPFQNCEGVKIANVGRWNGMSLVIWWSESSWLSESLENSGVEWAGGGYVRHLWVSLIRISKYGARSQLPYMLWQSGDARQASPCRVSVFYCLLEQERVKKNCSLALDFWEVVYLRSSTLCMKW